MSDDPARIDEKQAVARVMKLMAIPGRSGCEGDIVRAISDELRRAGIAASAITTDSADRRILGGGETGNLIVKLPGRGAMARAPRRMLAGHVDTVPICEGCHPVRKGNWIEPADKSTGLGADNRAGAAVVLTAAIEIMKRKLPHPPLTLLFPVQEEVGLRGARYLAVGKLGKPKLAFNFDGGSPGKLTVGATGAYRMSIVVEGIASHAGVAPQQGVNAITVASLAIADLHRRRWLGQVRKGRSRGTSNIGFINAGGATNVVTEKATLRAEVRSGNPVFRRAILRTFVEAFKAAVKRVPNARGKYGRVRIDHHLDYESFELAATEPCVEEATRVVRAVGLKPLRSVADGGLDANWLTKHRIPTVTLGAGQRLQHTTSEKLNVEEFLLACRIGLRLATAL